MAFACVPFARDHSLPLDERQAVGGETQRAPLPEHRTVPSGHSHRRQGDPSVRVYLDRLECHSGDALVSLLEGLIAGRFQPICRDCECVVQVLVDGVVEALRQFDELGHVERRGRRCPS